MNTTGMTVHLNLGRHDSALDFHLSGSTANLVCLLTALEKCEPETLPPNAIGLTQELSKLLTALRSRQ